MANKLILTSVLSFVPRDARMPVGMVFALVYTIIILLSQPYARKLDERMHLIAYIEVTLFFLTVSHLFIRS
jgi:hypothetical protein